MIIGYDLSIRKRNIGKNIAIIPISVVAFE